jgi:hypothetical protein
MVRMQSSHLFWPSHRKLFRQRTRVRAFVAAGAVLAMGVLALVMEQAGWI